MKLKILLTLTLLISFAIYGNAQQIIFVLGQITSVENGLPVDQKEVTIELDNGVAVVVNTNQNGVYNSELLIQPDDSVSFLAVSVTDCNLQTQQQVFPTGNQTQFQANFEICTQSTNCQASFIYLADSVNQQLIGFDNLSSPVSYSTFWNWDFGDGTISNNFEPVHEYAQPGIYNVCLTMVDSITACTSTFCFEVWVNLLPLDCEALYSSDVQGNTVAFTDLSTGFPDAWLWNFGDGTTSAEQNPVHSWNVPGVYPVCLTIYNDSTQCEDTFCSNIIIADSIPGCHADFSYAQVQELTYAFTNLSTGQPDQFIWDFGDGTPFSYETNPIHNWEQAGIYHVCLAIIDNLTGCQDVMCLYITVGDTISACQASFIYLADSVNQQLIGFENLSFPVSYSTFWNWDFGDGIISNNFEPVHEYAQPGIYNVCLTMVDSITACTSTFCFEVWVNLLPLDCEALYSSDVQGNTVAFTDLSTGFPDAWLWNFGDGTTSAEQNPVHSWNVPGVYPVCLTIYNDSTQCEDTFCSNIIITDSIPGCHADFSYAQVQGLTYAFTNLSTGQPDQFIWDFGDGTPFSYETNPIHTWAQAGIYHVCLAIISNLTGCQDVMCLYITVGDTISACQADFTYLVDSVPGNPNHYWFIDSSTGINISSWYWDFGDGTISFIRHPDHTFADSGTYEVCLTISGQGNTGYCSSSICKLITTPAYHNLGGQVFAGNFPINNPDFSGDTALVRLYRKSGDRLSEIARANFWEYGYFYFFDVLEGEYVVQADLTPESNAYTSYLPAYSGNAQYWQLAQSFGISGGDVFDADVVMPALPPMENGLGLISGQVVCADNSPVDLRERIIYLLLEGNIVSLSHTDTLGNFLFSGIPLGAYTLRAEIAGKYSEALVVNLTEVDNQAMQLQLFIASSNVYGIDNTDSFVNGVKLFPNPANGSINVTFNLDQQTTLVSEVYSSLGIICLSETHFCQSGENKLTLNIASLKSGFYLIALKSARGALLQTIKFSKI